MAACSLVRSMEGHSVGEKGGFYFSGKAILFCLIMF